MAEWLGIGAALWGVLMALSPVLQIRRITLRRSSADVSLACLAVLGVVTMAISWRYRNAAER